MEENLEDMIDRVDAVILAKDDPEIRVSMSQPIIDANIPIFIDKPLAISHGNMDWFSGEVGSAIIEEAECGIPVS